MAGLIAVASLSFRAVFSYLVYWLKNKNFSIFPVFRELPGMIQKILDNYSVSDIFQLFLKHPFWTVRWKPSVLLPDVRFFVHTIKTLGGQLILLFGERRKMAQFRSFHLLQYVFGSKTVVSRLLPKLIYLLGRLGFYEYTLKKLLYFFPHESNKCSL